MRYHVNDITELDNMLSNVQFASAIPLAIFCFIFFFVLCIYFASEVLFAQFRVPPLEASNCTNRWICIVSTSHILLFTCQSEQVIELFTLAWNYLSTYYRITLLFCSFSQSNNLFSVCLCVCVCGYAFCLWSFNSNRSITEYRTICDIAMARSNAKNMVKSGNTLNRRCFTVFIISWSDFFVCVKSYVSAKFALRIHAFAIFLSFVNS